MLDKDKVDRTKAGTGIGKTSADFEKQDNDRIVTKFKPRGSHTLGLEFDSKRREQKEEQIKRDHPKKTEYR